MMTYYNILKNNYNKYKEFIDFIDIELNIPIIVLGEVNKLILVKDSINKNKFNYDKSLNNNSNNYLIKIFTNIEEVRIFIKEKKIYNIYYNDNSIRNIYYLKKKNSLIYKSSSNNSIFEINFNNIFEDKLKQSYSGVYMRIIKKG